MNDYYREEAEKLETLNPKLTKEQKIVKKALIQIGRASFAKNKAMRDGFLCSASGLLEALLFIDDKEAK